MIDKPHKNILILSDPPSAPGYMPRVRYLCEYLVRNGYQVTWITEEYQPLLFEHSYSIISIPMYSGGIVDWAIKTIWTLLTNWHNRAFGYKVLNLKSINKEWDLVLCSTFSDFPLIAAQQISEQLNIPLLCDIRDLYEQVDNSRYQYKHKSWWLMPFRKIYNSIHINQRNKVLRKADAITAISPWHAKFIRQFNPNTHLVYNGFDDKQFYPEDIKTDKFTITYIGNLYDWQLPALQRVKQVIKELNLPIQLDIHHPTHNSIPHDLLGDAIRRSGIMLVLTSPGTHGMLTTKFYEALGCEKPILCVPSDNGALAELIEHTNAGIATDDQWQIKTFIIEKYNEWKKSGYTHQKTRYRSDFSREAQSQQIEDIIQQLLLKHTT